MGNDPYAGEDATIEFEEKSTSECPAHFTGNTICGGPHDEIFTDLGWEIVKSGDDPLGTRLTPTEADALTKWSLSQKQNGA